MNTNYKIRVLFFALALIFSTYILHAQEDKWQGKAVDFSHGRLEVHPDKRFLCHADGTPFFYLGDTAWELFHRLDETEIDTYLENRREKGFNVIQAVILAELDGLNTPNKNGDRPLLGNDPRKPNEAYFAWVDKVIRKAAGKGMYIGLLPTWGDKVDVQWGTGPVVFDTDNAYTYGQYLGERYKDFPNIIWINGGDRSGGGKNKEIWNAMAKGIRSADSNHLMTFHPIGAETSGSWFHDYDWLDFNSCQTGHAYYTYDIFEKLIAGDYNRQSTKPAINLEPCYEDHPVRGQPEGVDLWFDESNVRHALYWSLFSGAFGHTYGCHPVWQFMAPGYTPVGGVRNNWYDVLDLPGAWDLIHARRLFESYDFFNRQPDNTIILTPQTESKDYAIATKGDRYALIYLPHGNSVEVSLEKISGTKKIKLIWFNPRTGKKTGIGTKAAKGSFVATPPSSGKNNDWILIMERY